MNAPLRKVHIETAIDEAFATRRSLDRAIEIYGNGYDDNKESAVEAIASGRAAYWTTSRYGSARTVDLPLALNRGVSISEALEQAFPSWCADHRAAALDTIVPLNSKAVNSLALAYARAGSFLDDAELEMRAKRDTRRQTKREPFTYANFKAGRV